MTTRHQSYPLDQRHDVDPIGRVAELYDRISFDEVFFSQSQSRETERLQRTKNPLRVFRAHPNPRIKIAVVATQTMGRDGVATDYEKADVVSDERLDKLSEVRIELYLLPQSFVGGSPQDLQYAQSSIFRAKIPRYQLLFREWSCSRRVPSRRWIEFPSSHPFYWCVSELPRTHMSINEFSKLQTLERRSLLPSHASASREERYTN